MPSLISHLSRTGQRELLDDLNYLNLEEMRGFCRKHAIPWVIFVETEAGERRRTRDSDRKSVVLERVRHYLKTGKALGATCFAASVVRLDEPPPEVLRSSDRLYYGWYDKSNPAMIDLLRDLTDGTFRNGAIARILCREFWTAGTAPTFAEYAKAWMREHRKGLGHHPEAAYLTDLARSEAGSEWKQKRIRIAERTLATLATIRRP